jgi:hypothetical protein
MQDEDSLLPLFEVENGLPAKIEAISTSIKVSCKYVLIMLYVLNTDKILSKCVLNKIALFFTPPLYYLRDCPSTVPTAGFISCSVNKPVKEINIIRRGCTIISDVPNPTKFKYCLF